MGIIFTRNECQKGREWRGSSFIERLHRAVNLENAFKAFDQDGDGRISQTEFHTGLRKLQIAITTAPIWAGTHLDSRNRRKQLQAVYPR